MAAWIEPLEEGPRCRRWKLHWSRGSRSARRKRTRVFEGRKRDALASLRAFEAECDSEPDGCMSLSQYMRDLAGVRLDAGVIGANTAAQYRWAARVLDVAMPGRLASVSRSDALDALAAVSRGCTPSGEPLSQKSVSQLVKCARVACSEAVRAGLAPCNPFDGVSVPSRSKPRRALDVAASARLLGALGHENACSFAASVMLRTGLRASEALGVSWDDLGDMALNVRREVTKTDAGVRSVPLSSADIEYIGMRRDFLQKVIGDAGGSLEGSDRLCCSNDGRPLSYNALRLWWARHRDALGVGGMVLHELRHTYLSNLAQAGVHPSVMQRLAGHSSMAVTMEVYTHAQDADLRAAVDGLSELRGTHRGTHCADSCR